VWGWVGGWVGGEAVRLLAQLPNASLPVSVHAHAHNYTEIHPSVPPRSAPRRQHRHQDCLVHHRPIRVHHCPVVDSVALRPPPELEAPARPEDAGGDLDGGAAADADDRDGALGRDAWRLGGFGGCARGGGGGVGGLVWLAAAAAAALYSLLCVREMGRTEAESLNCQTRNGLRREKPPPPFSISSLTRHNRRDRVLPGRGQRPPVARRALPAGGRPVVIIHAAAGYCCRC
jgi:hypothetical protein